jgi:glyoxylase-like metal-dependent hydrolase (beta-lactamase superfamily II)
MEWNGHKIVFILTPGHSPGSVCIAIDNLLFGGDTLMPFKPFIKKRNSGSMEQLKDSIDKLEKSYSPSTIVYPGHGESGKLSEMIIILKRYE